MLEIKNVKRIYKPKKGVPVIALDDVSLKFADTGMVFLLGKSGSGKSTLLNVMGGLDKYDEGEIIIKGKSSKDFSQGDFDSYRNTYLGFIFQEYNILNEFTVGANIGLALELQGRKATSEAVNAILEEVDLVGYGSRKPSELSGGQKQRVAIARALVKSPEIIMADEPTGALDSATGLQVFDTLKKLSSDKLVIVVTHDREFAELYGDRVIELKDGKVISDIEKFKSESHKRNDSITIIDDKIIQIKKGYKLTSEDLKYINAYISEQDAILSIDKKTNADMKKFARIDVDGNREAFKDTDESQIIRNEDKKFKLIKSKLPLKNSFKIGASSLKNKPFRLFLTILLSMVAFCMFGLADTMGSYNKYTTTRTSIVDSNINSFTLQKTKVRYYEGRNYPNETTINSNDSDIVLLKEKIGLDFDRVYIPSNIYELSFSGALSDITNELSSFTGTFGGFFETNAEKLADLGFSYKGTLPSKDTEIAISEYVYKHFEKFGYRNGGTTKKASEIINESVFLAFNPKFKINEVEYTITAIIDTEFDYKHFESLNEPNGNVLVSYLMLTELNDTVKYGYHGLIFVQDGYIDRQIEPKEAKGAGINMDKSSFYITNQSREYNALQPATQLSASARGLFNISDLNDSGYQKNITGSKTSLSKNEFILDFNTYITLIESAVFQRVGNYYGEEERIKDIVPDWFYQYKRGFSDLYQFAQDYILELLDSDASRFDDLLVEEGVSLEEIDQMSLKDKSQQVFYYLDANKDDDTYCKSFNQIEVDYNVVYGAGIDNYLTTILNAAMLREDILDSKGLVPTKFYLSAYCELTGYNNYDSELTLVGIFYNPESEGNNIFVIDDVLYGNMDTRDLGNYAYLIAKMPSDTSTLTKIIKFSYDYNENETIYYMKNGVMSTLSVVNELIETLAKVFLYVGLGFAVFASLMLMNYIATSISYKRREIGILRAVGARSSDVFGIFFNESLLIALINFVLATIATVVTVIIINNSLRTEYNLLITLLNFGIRQVLLMLGISVAVAFVASFLPVYKVARQRPIDAIKK